MKELQLEITLESDALVGSGESYGSIIDADIVFESNGLPFIPAKRIKGCLRDSVEEILFLFYKADENYKIKNEVDLESCFGQRYSSLEKNEIEEVEFRGNQGKIHYENLMLVGYDNLSNWLNSISKEKKKYANLFSKESVLSQYTRIKRQTSIDSETGTAKETSLRTMRVLKKALVFQGNISISDDKKILYTLALAVSNFNSLGTSRNRGLGNITAKLKENKIDITKKYLEELKIKCK